jgi:hypothetical protein
MPKLNDNQVTGIAGEKWFASVLPHRWIPQPPIRDIGVDLLVVICEDGPWNGLEFKVQVKSSRKWTIRDSSVVVSGFKVSALKDLLIGFTPALLVLHETSTSRGVCAWINQLLGKDVSLISTKRKTVSLHVPLVRPIDSEIWKTLGQELHGLYVALGRRVMASEKTLPIIRFLHGMSDVLDLFDLVAHAAKSEGPMTDEDRGFLAEAEVVCHSNVIRHVRRLEEALAGSPLTIQGLSTFAEDYEQRCSQFIRNFSSVVSNTATPNTVAVVVEEMKARRDGFIRSVVRCMKQVSELGLGLPQTATEDERQMQANKTSEGIRQSADGLPKPSM